MLKAISEQGIRLNIRKTTLRRWRSEFARNLRLLGVSASATERAVRGATRKAKKDGIYRASLRGDSRHIRAQAEGIATQLLNGDDPIEPGKRALLQTRRDVEHGWRAVATQLQGAGYHELASAVIRFVNRMPQPMTELELMRDEIHARLRAPKTVAYARSSNPTVVRAR